MKLLSIGSDAKTVKGEKKGYLTGILYLAPGKESGFQVCPNASPGCLAACLYTAGRGGMDATKRARIRKTIFFVEERNAFMNQLVREIASLVAKAARKGMTPVVRLNGTSDIVWERVSVQGHENIMAIFPNVQFYDYTKRTNRRRIPPNYHLTFSLSETNEADARRMAQRGMNVAVVFRGGLPDTHWRTPVVDGDDSDLRFLDKPGAIVGLKAKGKARKDTSGFVQDGKVRLAVTV